MGKMGPGESVHYKEVFTNQGSTLERFHCTTKIAIQLQNIKSQTDRKYILKVNQSWFAIIMSLNTSDPKPGDHTTKDTNKTNRNLLLLLNLISGTYAGNYKGPENIVQLDNII